MRVKNGKDKCTASKCASSTIITIFLILLCSILVTFSVIFFWGDFSISGLLEAALPAIYVIGSVLVFSFLVFLILFISVRCCNNSISGIAFSIVLAVLCCMIVTTSSGVIGYDYYHFVNVYFLHSRYHPSTESRGERGPRDNRRWGRPLRCQRYRRLDFFPESSPLLRLWKYRGDQDGWGVPQGRACRLLHSLL